MKQALLLFTAAIALAWGGSMLPDQGLWSDLKRELCGPNGDEYFMSSVKDALIPGGIEKDGVRIEQIRGKLVSWSPPGNPRKLSIRVLDGGDAEALLHLAEPFEGPLRAGMECRFEGVPTWFTRSPFVLELNVRLSQVACR